MSTFLLILATLLSFCTSQLCTDLHANFLQCQTTYGICSAGCCTTSGEQYQCNEELLGGDCVTYDSHCDACIRACEASFLSAALPTGSVNVNTAYDTLPCESGACPTPTTQPTAHPFVIGSPSKHPIPAPTASPHACGAYTCNPTADPTSTCGGEPTLIQCCTGGERDTECSACCYADYVAITLFGGQRSAATVYDDTLSCYSGPCPTVSPTNIPSETPTVSPTNIPSESPTKYPTVFPTVTPTQMPSGSPSKYPTSPPSESPTKYPTENPSDSPSEMPSASPSEDPSASPSRSPTDDPSVSPSSDPSKYPTGSPTLRPTRSPLPGDGTHPPSLGPTAEPSVTPTGNPSVTPSASPSEVPSGSPSDMPSVTPTDMPSETPSETPVAVPTMSPEYMRSTDSSDVITSEVESSVPTKGPNCSGGGEGCNSTGDARMVGNMVACGFILIVSMLI